jgi:hypothetical protein
MRVSDNALRKLIKGTFLATLLLAAMEGGRPFNEATWILVGAVLITVVDAYATHMSGCHEAGLPAYFGSLYHGIVNDLPRIMGAVPTVVILVFAGLRHWQHDHRNPDGSVTVGYETIGRNHPLRTHECRLGGGSSSPSSWLSSNGFDTRPPASNPLPLARNACRLSMYERHREARSVPA